LGSSVSDDQQLDGSQMPGIVARQKASLAPRQPTSAKSARPWLAKQTLNKSARAKHAADSAFGMRGAKLKQYQAVLREFAFDADRPNAAMHQPQQIASEVPQERSSCRERHAA
jgi:hypothetical protein